MLMDHSPQDPEAALSRLLQPKDLDVAEQPTSPLVLGVIQQRAQTMRTQTSSLAAIPPPSQERTGPARPKRSLLRFLLTLLWLRRVPVLLQMSMVECGAACLAMILSYYGRRTSISEIREHCSLARDGLSALALMKAARWYGLRARPITVKEPDKLRYANLPAIIHWEFNHFLVLERWTPTFVEVVDPARGRVRLSADEFDAGFTGIILLLEPGVQFEKRSQRGISLLSYAQRYIRQAPLALLQVLGTSLLLQLAGLGTPLLTELVVDHLLPLQLKSVLSIVAVGMLILLLAQLLLTVLRSSLLIYLQARVDTQMMLGFFEHLLTLPLRFFQQRSSGDILARLNSNSVIRDTLSSQLVSVLLDGGFVLSYLVILGWQSPLFFAVVLAIALLQLLVLLGSRKAMQHLTRQELKTQGEAQGYIAEVLVGIVTVKAAGAEQRSLERWSNLFFQQLNASLKRNYLSTWVNAIMNLLQTFSPMALLLVGTVLVLDGQMQVGTMLALNAVAASFLNTLSSLVNTGQSVQMVQSHLERIADVLEAEPEQSPQSIAPPPKLTGSVELRNVSFRFSPETSEILHNVSVTIQAGQKVALVGRTGSGKSTLGKLLLGLYLPTEGEIFYDGIPLRSLDYQAVRSQFGVVMQEATIFNGSIRQNITFNTPDMSLEHITQAAYRAALHDDILQMPMGYDTMVSEGGAALSGGQRQRLALARALANAPAILLLDEATSALDVVTEQVIERNLGELSCTQILIAHRLSTVRHADVILVLDQGRIIEQGTHQELLQRNGSYAYLIRSQLPRKEPAG
jgi:HlyB family type I secretion system ABC transporter